MAPPRSRASLIAKAFHNGRRAALHGVPIRAWSRVMTGAAASSSSARPQSFRASVRPLSSCADTMSGCSTTAPLLLSLLARIWVCPGIGSFAPHRQAPSRSVRAPTGTFGLRARTSRFPRPSRSLTITATTTLSTQRPALHLRRRPASRTPLRTSPSAQSFPKASVSNGRPCERSRVRCASATLRPATGLPRKT